MGHAKITRQQMLEWIARCAARGSDMPDDVGIVERFNLPGSESARTLLAELVEAGQITVDWNAEPRAITLGAKKPTPIVPAKPLAATVKTEEARRARSAPPERRAQIKAIVEKLGERAIPLAPPPPKPTPTEPAAAGSRASGVPDRPETSAGFAPVRKPRISAAVIRAARRDDMPLDGFVTMLIERGFASYEADAAQERAA